MRKQYKRVLASAMAAILIWNTCGWQVPALAASVVYQVEEIEQLPEEVLYQEVPYTCLLFAKRVFISSFTSSTLQPQMLSCG